MISPFSIIFLFVAVSVAIVANSLIIPSVFFGLAFCNELLRVWATKDG